MYITWRRVGLSASTELLVTGRLPWQPAGIKFTQCVSGQKSAFSSLQEKLCVGSKNDSHLLELSRRSLSACKVWGDRTTRAGCRSKNWCFLFVTLGLPARGDIVQTSIVWRFMCRFWRYFQHFFRMDCSFRGTTQFSFPSLGGATIFAKLRSKIAKSPKIGGKVCAHHFV